MNPETVIRPELVAGKLAAVDNLECSSLVEALAAQPRLVELMWHIQQRSFQPGSVEKLVEDVLAFAPARFVTKSMQAAGPPLEGRYSLAQCWQAWKGFEQCDTKWRLHNYATLEDESTPKPHAEKLTFGEWLSFHFDSGLLAKAVEGDAEVRKGVERFNWPFLSAECQEAARYGLAKLLRSFCVDKDGGFYVPWYCPDLISVLFDFMDHHAAQTRNRLAQTEVAKQVTYEVGYAWEAKCLVHINGNSRFGKTEAFKAEAEATPGRFRLVTVPPGNALQDLILAVAGALGIPTTFGMSGPDLRRKVEYILDHGRLGILFDEAHYLFPVNIARNTAPARLDWVRAAIIDKGLPCVLSATPQAWNEQSARFVKITKCNLEQFLGRRALVVNLPEKLSQEDLRLCLAIHFPGLPSSAEDEVVGVALATTSFLQTVTSISTRARYRAKHRGAAGVALEDLDAAIEAVAPGYGVASLDDAEANPPPRGDTATPPPQCREAAAGQPRGKRKTSAEVIGELLPGKRETICPSYPVANRGTAPVPAVESLAPA